MPWKNGLGMTTELAVKGHDQAREDSPFLWRVSIAGVKKDGPFSNFPNIERHLMLLDGNGITLDGGGHGVGILFERLQVYSFSGDIDISGRLSKGPISDLNLMVDRRFVSADMTGFNVIHPEKIMLKSDIHFLHLIDGSAPVVLDVDGQLTMLESGDSLEISEERALSTIMQVEDSIEPPAVAFISLDFK